jgi:hypothetical protein
LINTFVFPIPFFRSLIEFNITSIIVWNIPDTICFNSFSLMVPSFHQPIIVRQWLFDSIWLRFLLSNCRLCALYFFDVNHRQFKFCFSSIISSNRKSNSAKSKFVLNNLNATVVH